MKKAIVVLLVLAAAVAWGETSIFLERKGKERWKITSIYTSAAKGGKKKGRQPNDHRPFDSRGCHRGV